MKSFVILSGLLTQKK